MNGYEIVRSLREKLAQNREKIIRDIIGGNMTDRTYSRSCGVLEGIRLCEDWLGETIRDMNELK